MKKTALINHTLSWLCAVSLAAGTFTLPSAAFAADAPAASSESVSVYAAGQYTVTFETNGGSEIQPIVITNGELLTLPENPTKDGQKFLRWYTDAALTTPFDSTQMLSDDTTLYARWFTPVTQDSVTYDKPLDAEIFDTMSGAITTGNYVLTDDINIPENYFLAIGRNCDVKLHLNGHKIECYNSNTVFKVEGSLTVTDNEDGTKGSITSSGNIFTMSSPEASTLNLYNVSCISGKSTIYSASGTGTSISIYSGEFSPVTASDDFVIVETYDDKLTTLNVYDGKFNGIIAKPTNALDITITGGLFPMGTLNQTGLNWDSNGEYKAAYNWDYNMVEVSYYGTEYFLNGHGGPQPDRVKYGDALVEPKPTDPDWAFAGWYWEKECINQFDFSSYPTALQLKLYAKWEAKAISSIEIASPPAKTTYKEGDTFDLTGLVVTAIYNTGDTITVPYEGNEADFSVNIAGRLSPDDTEILISYLEFTAEQPITVEPRQLQSVSLAKGSMKVAYFLNDSYLLDGVEVLLTYDNGDTEIVKAIENRESFSFSPATFQTARDVDVTIYYLGYEMTEQVYVFPEAVSYISVKTPPTKTSYFVGEVFDPTGLVLNVKYNSGRTDEAPYESGDVYYTYSPDTELSLTDTTIQINYYGKTTTLDITVRKRSSDSDNQGNQGGGRRDNNTTSEKLLLINGNQTAWSELIELIKRGDVTAELNGISSIPTNVIQALKDSRHVLTLLYDSKTRWTIDGAELTAVHSADVTIAKTLSQRSNGLAGTEAAQFSVNGTDIAALRLITGNAGKFANVYVTANGKRTLAGVYRIDANGEIMLNITTKGDYIVMTDEYSALTGDVNNDGIVNALDASAVLRHIVDIEDAENPLVADFNGDGTINALDASAILKMLTD